MYNIRIAFSLFAASFVWFILPLVAIAHPLGDFVVNRYSRLELEVDQIYVYYAVDVAEVTTFQEKAYMDLNGNEEIEEAEIGVYLDGKLEEYQKNLHLLVDDSRVALQPLEQNLEFRPGDGELETMFITARFVADLPHAEAGWQVEFLDDTYQDRLGWREVVVQAGDEVTLLESSAPTEDLSQGLNAYPEGVTEYSVNHALIRFQPAALSASGAESVVVPAVAGTGSAETRIVKEDDPFANLLDQTLSSSTSILIAFGLAIFWGALHALSPGHGKTIVAAYLVGSRGTVKHALFLGLITTLTHTAGVFILGFITLFASSYILPEQLYPWLSVASGLLVVGIGLMLLRGYLTRFQAGSEAALAPQNAIHVATSGNGRMLAHAHVPPQHGGVGHEHGHPHDHSHTHDHPHDHHHDHSHDHHHDRSHDHSHAFSRDHVHDHHPEHAAGAQSERRKARPLQGEQNLGCGQRHLDVRDHHHDSSDQSHAHDHQDEEVHYHFDEEEGVFYHSHGAGPMHKHVIPQGAEISWGSLLALGVSGGLIPCPSALIVMLSAIALQRIGLGLVLIVMFSIGLAGVLVAIGILWVKAADWLNQFSSRGGPWDKLPFGRRLVHLVPAASAAFIVVVGIGITLRALFQTGIVGV